VAIKQGQSPPSPLRSWPSCIQGLPSLFDTLVPCCTHPCHRGHCVRACPNFPSLRDLGVLAARAIKPNMIAIENSNLIGSRFNIVPIMPPTPHGGLEHNERTDRVSLRSSVSRLRHVRSNPLCDPRIIAALTRAAIGGTSAIDASLIARPGPQHLPGCLRGCGTIATLQPIYPTWEG